MQINSSVITRLSIHQQSQSRFITIFFRNTFLLENFSVTFIHKTSTTTLIGFNSRSYNSRKVRMFEFPLGVLINKSNRLQQLCNKNIDRQMLKLQPLANMFGDNTYAWQLLESEILIETTEEPSGNDISNLLQLYMRGVEVMNTSMDPREPYFRSKVTALMAKNTVRKTFKASPNPESAQKPEVNVVLKTEPVQQVKKKTKSKKNNDGLVSASTLQEKKKELQLRLAYAAEEHNPDGLRKIIAQNMESQIKIVSKVQKIMQSHQQKLNERINKRKLKTATFKSRAEDQSQTLQSLQQEESSVQIPITNQKSIDTLNVILQTPTRQSDRKLHKSADTKAVNIINDNIESSQQGKERNIRSRKLSFDILIPCY